MKVFLVWEGRYSDRGLMGVFSTYEAAENYRKARALFTDDIDDKPEEWEVDSTVQTDDFVFVYLDSNLNPVESGFTFMHDETRECEQDRSGRYRVRVHFYPDADRMLKAARDKIVAFQARRAGI